jgi:hypothetical protein
LVFWLTLAQQLAQLRGQQTGPDRVVTPAHMWEPGSFHGVLDREDDDPFDARNAPL